MFKFVPIFLILLLGSCRQPVTQTTGESTEDALLERGRMASAALYAAREVDKLNPDKNIYTDVVSREGEVAIVNLPTPRNPELEQALERALAALKVEREKVSELYISATEQAQKLEEALASARARDVELEANRKSQTELLAKQTKWLTFVGIALIVGGVLLNVLPEPFRQTRIGIALGFCGLLLNIISRLLLSIPQWAYQVLFGGVVLACFAIPIGMFWAYRAGLFQKPPEQVGDFKITNT